jgi:hypothetical protein
MGNQIPGFQDNVLPSLSRLKMSTSTLEDEESMLPLNAEIQ